MKYGLVIERVENGFVVDDGATVRVFNSSIELGNFVQSWGAAWIVFGDWEPKDKYQTNIASDRG